MPELPDVEGFRRVLAEARGRAVQRVAVRDEGVLRGVSARRLRRDLEGRHLGRADRHGKWLIGRTEGPAMMLHFGMTGSLLLCSAGDPPHPHDRVVLDLDEGQLRFRDQRKLQGIRLEDDAAVERILADQGPDALAVDPAAFGELLSRRRAALKAVLLDQSAIAGLGNLLADEILWRSRIHPARRADGTAAAERRRVHREMRRVLRSSVEAERVPPRGSWLTGHRDRPHPRCPRCRTPLSRGRIAGRTTVWCPVCQREPGH